MMMSSNAVTKFRFDTTSLLSFVRLFAIDQRKHDMPMGEKVLEGAPTSVEKISNQKNLWLFHILSLRNKQEK